MGNYEYELSQLSIEEDRSELIDRHGIKYNFSNSYTRQEINLKNGFQEISFKVEKVDPETIALDSMIFKSCLTREEHELFSIDLLEIETNDVLDFDDDLRSYSLTIKPTKDGELLLKLGDVYASLSDLPVFLSCTHCESGKEVMVVLDRHVKYSDFKQLIYYLGVANIERLSVVTKSDELGIYKGITENLMIWQEDLNAFSKAINYPMPPPIFKSRERFINSQEELSYFQAQHVNDIEHINKLARKENTSVLVNLDHLTSVDQYVRIKLSIKEMVSKMRNEVSLKLYRKRYDELSQELKKELLTQVPSVITELRERK